MNMYLSAGLRVVVIEAPCGEFLSCPVSRSNFAANTLSASIQSHREMKKQRWLILSESDADIQMFPAC